MMVYARPPYTMMAHPMMPGPPQYPVLYGGGPGSPGAPHARALRGSTQTIHSVVFFLLFLLIFFAFPHTMCRFACIHIVRRRPRTTTRRQTTELQSFLLCILYNDELC